ncbi:MAG: adenylate kinase [bacterium]|nr:adenylate kinase [bacterium]
MNLIIAGPQGAGKGTQGKLLAEKLGLEHLETGRMFREAAGENTALGRQIAVWMNKGALIPDAVVFRLIEEHLTKEVLKKGFIIDGSPRNLIQAKWFDKMLTRKNARVDKLIFLRLSEKESILRLSARRVCPKCGKNYNLLSQRPKKDNICDICGEELVVRKDDTPQAIATRLKNFNKETAPMISYYRQKGKVAEINAEESIENVAKEIRQKLGIKQDD